MSRLGFLALLSCVSSAAIAQVPIPTDPPPTGMQGKLPNPIGATPRPDRPEMKSPSLQSIAPGLANRSISLDDAVSVALAASPHLAQAGQNLYAAEGREKEAASGFNPVVGVNPGESFIRHIAAPAWSLQATLPIDVSHLIAASVSQAQFQEVSARLDVNRVRNEIVYAVKSQFYAVLRAQSLVKVAKENLQDSVERLNDAQARYKAQAVSYIDVVRAQTDVADGQKQVIQAQNSVQNAVANLANAMGIEVTTPLQLDPVNAVNQPPGVDAPLPLNLSPEREIDAAKDTSAASDTATLVNIQGVALGPEFRSVLDEALKTRPEVYEADANVAAAKQGILIAKRSELPTFQVGVGYFDLRSNTGTQIDEPQAFVGLSIPVYDGGLARARGQEARASVSNAETSKRIQLDAIVLDVQRAYLALVQARDQTAVASQAVVQAKAAFDIARTRYNAGVASKAGLSPQLEVSDAQAALTLAEQNQVNAIYDYNGARAQLDRSVGRFAYLAGTAGYPNLVSAAKSAH